MRLWPKSRGGSAAAGGLAAVLAIAVPIVANFEGLYTYVYRDPVGVLTYCYGETENIPAKGTRFTPQECADLLKAKLPRYDAEMMACVKVPITDKMRAAFLSFSYNVGTGAFCKSTLVRLLNQQKYREACDQLTRWTKAGGRTLLGLVRRRGEERTLCREGLPA